MRGSSARPVAETRAGALRAWPARGIASNRLYLPAVLRDYVV
jgi:hypothetical protein